MYVYPVRGIRAGAQVDHLYLGMHGAMYDREVLLAAKEDKAVVTTNKYHEMGCLRQVLNGSVVTITSLKPERLRAKGQPESLSIELKDDPESVGEFIEVERGYSGYQFNEKVNQWFSAAIDKEVFAIRSPLRRRTRMNPKRLIFDRHDDLRKSFCSDAAFHVINKASVQEVEKRMKERHPDGLPNFFISTEQFRPNIVFEWPVPFAEDGFYEMRVGPILLRNSGPCVRCSTIRMNLDTNVKVEEQEPYSTIATFRTVPGMGVLFGMYYQMDVLETPMLYSQTLPKMYGFPSMEQTLRLHPVISRPGEGDDQKYVLVKRDFGIHLRWDEKMDWTKKFAPMKDYSSGK